MFVYRHNKNYEIFVKSYKKHKRKIAYFFRYSFEKADKLIL